jgi:hypothetical protein
VRVGLTGATAVGVLIGTSVADGKGPCVGNTSVGGTDVGTLSTGVEVCTGVAVRITRGVDERSTETVFVAVELFFITAAARIGVGVWLDDKSSGSLIRMIK